MNEIKTKEVWTVKVNETKIKNKYYDNLKQLLSDYENSITIKRGSNKRTIFLKRDTMYSILIYPDLEMEGGKK